jgi:hypothetical protein
MYFSNCEADLQLQLCQLRVMAWVGFAGLRVTQWRCPVSTVIAIRHPAEWLSSLQKESTGLYDPSCNASNFYLGAWFESWPKLTMQIGFSLFSSVAPGIYRNRTSKDAVGTTLPRHLSVSFTRYHSNIKRYTIELLLLNKKSAVGSYLCL